MDERKKKILLVDDEKSILKLLTTRLSYAGYEIVTAGDGLEAIEKAKSEAPDLIILDVMMPKMDGFTVNKKLKENDQTKDIPVIISTAKGEVREAFSMDEKFAICAFLEKPFKVDILMEYIKKYIKK
jgi:DNA-binding response OmpR family regulator